MIKLSYVNYWKEDSHNSYLTKFIEHNIGEVVIVNNHDSPDILISSCMGDINKVKKLKAKCKLFYYGENLDRYPPYNNFKLLEDTFDLIVGFKHTNISRKIVKFPLWLTYYNFYSWDDSNNILNYIQNKYNENVAEKTHFGSIVARHDAGGQRTKIYNTLSNYGEILSPSRYRNNCPPIGPTNKDKIHFISKCKYNICPENSCYEGYFTEKIFQAFEGGTIPLYWAISRPEPDIINENKYCFCDINNQQIMEKSICDAVNNPNKYIEGEIFKGDAKHIIKMFYDTLSENIKILIFS